MLLEWAAQSPMSRKKTEVQRKRNVKSEILGTGMTSDNLSLDQSSRKEVEMIQKLGDIIFI